LTSITTTAKIDRERQTFVGGSDVCIIMGGDEATLLRLLRERAENPCVLATINPIRLTVSNRNSGRAI
jgi:hypothetical protein